jgi:simple sugar transport system permease protein
VKREPIIRVVKRSDVGKSHKVLLYLGAIVLSLAMGALLLMSLGINPLEYYKEMVTIGMIDNRFAYKSVEGLIKVTVPLMITSVSLSMAFRMRFWNIGGEGQFIMGAICASAVALTAPASIGSAATLVLMCIAGAAGAGVWGLIPAVLKVRFGTNETLMTLMLNYIALYFLYFLGETKADWNFFLSTDSVRPVYATFSENAWMPSVSIGKFSLNLSLIFAFLIFIILYIYLTKTKHGYEISVVGDSPATARYAGMNVGWITVRTMLISACLIGLAGAFYVSTSHTLSNSVTGDVGWTGIIVAWLSKLNPAAIFINSILISVLQFGCQNAASDFAGINSTYADLLQGMILFLILAADFFARFKLVIRKPSRSGTGNEKDGEK